MRFLGNIEGKVDAKGRVFLPANFRKALQAGGEETLIMRKDIFRDCIVLYPDSVWSAKVAELRSRISDWGPDRDVLRQFMSEIDFASLDGNGRFLISKSFLEMAHIKQSVRFIGMDDTIEIWAAEMTEKPFVEKAEFSEKINSIMNPK